MLHMQLDSTLQQKMNGENEALIQATAYRDVENTMLNEEKPLTKGHLLHRSTHMKCPEKAIHEEKVDQWLLGGTGVGEGRSV